MDEGSSQEEVRCGMSLKSFAANRLGAFKSHCEIQAHNVLHIDVLIDIVEII
jgi:hypothetical protein